MATYKKRYEGIAYHMCMNPKCMKIRLGEGWYYETYFNKYVKRGKYILSLKYCDSKCETQMNFLWKDKHLIEHYKYLNPGLFPYQKKRLENNKYEKLKRLVAENYQLDLANERTSAFWYDRDIRVDIGIGIEVPAEDYFSPLWEGKRNRTSATTIKREPRKRVVKNNTVRTDNN